MIGIFVCCVACDIFPGLLGVFLLVFYECLYCFANFSDGIILWVCCLLRVFRFVWVVFCFCKWIRMFCEIFGAIFSFCLFCFFIFRWVAVSQLDFFMDWGLLFILSGYFIYGMRAVFLFLYFFLSCVVGSSMWDGLGCVEVVAWFAG